MGAPAGDLYITTHVEDHPLFRREGDNILLKVPITVAEAGLGAKIEVPTIDGKTLLKIPPGTQNEQKFRLRERGIFNTRKNARGDQIVQVTLKAPVVQDERTKELLRELAAAAPRRPAPGIVEGGAHRCLASLLLSQPTTFLSRDCKGTVRAICVRNPHAKDRKPPT